MNKTPETLSFIEDRSDLTILEFSKTLNELKLDSSEMVEAVNQLFAYTIRVANMVKSKSGIISEALQKPEFGIEIKKIEFETHNDESQTTAALPTRINKDNLQTNLRLEFAGCNRETITVSLTPDQSVFDFSSSGVSGKTLHAFIGELGKKYSNANNAVFSRDEKVVSVIGSESKKAIEVLLRTAASQSLIPEFL